MILEGNETDARLWEIAENLHRADLTVRGRVERIAEWVRLTEDKIGQLTQFSGNAKPEPAEVTEVVPEIRTGG